VSGFFVRESESLLSRDQRTKKITAPCNLLHPSP